MNDDNKLAALLKLGKIQEFNNLALRQPLKFSGPFDSQEEAESAVQRLVNQPRGPGQLFYTEKKEDEWWAMARLTDRVWKEWWEYLGWKGPDNPGR